jgi:hypothetical protein
MQFRRPMPILELDERRLVIMISWIDDNMILGPSDLAMVLKAGLMKQSVCDNCEVLQSTLETRSSTLAKTLLGLYRPCLCRATRTSFNLQTDATTHQQCLE